jgi:hypothetical protein
MYEALHQRTIKIEVINGEMNSTCMMPTQET